MEEYGELLEVKIKMDKVFLAHSSIDKEGYINEVANILKQNIGINNIVYDSFSFDMSYSIEEQIKESLKNTSIFILFLSPNSILSEWVEFELEEAIKLYSDNIKVICAINIYDINLENYISNVINDRVEYVIRDAREPIEAVAIIEEIFQNVMTITKSG